MIKHIVMWQLLPEASGQNREQNARTAKAMLEALPDRIPEIRSSRAAVDFTT